MRETAPNKALEPTAYSFGFAYASGGGSAPAFGCAETNRHDVKECKSPTVKV
jgi:hypothetical protein